MDPAKLKGVVVDDAKAEFKGNWGESKVARRFIGEGYHHDGNVNDGNCTARFETVLPKSGAYEVRLAVPHNTNRASNAKVKVLTPDGEKVLSVNQKVMPSIDGLFVSLGTFQFTKDVAAVVTISNEGADGYVVADAVQWLSKN
nr:hypothetical protein [Verrucomicrobium spinosum]